uniref:C2H2-type domain-containing protein n=1 Tax=Timema genevievae TaxID=629358 RepID=A0A7R9K3A2_TIMGE|nr:unnamed protein product [Timema genevievae]
MLIVEDELIMLKYTKEPKITVFFTKKQKSNDDSEGKQQDLKNLPATSTSLEKEHVAVEVGCGSTVPVSSSHIGISDGQHQPDNGIASGAVISQGNKNRKFSGERLETYSWLAYSAKDGAGSKQLCYYCGKESAFRWHLECHEKFSSGEMRPFSCHICNKSFTSKEILKRHYKLHLPDNPLCCDLSGEISLCKTASTRHQKIHYPKEHQCNICLKNYRDKSKLDFHMKYHYTDGIFPGVPCDICRKMLFSNSALKKHRKIHFPENHQCNICFKIFRNKSTLIIHQKCHQASEISKNFLCDICGYLCKSMGFLNRHISNVHSPKKKYICDVCGISYNILTYLKDHIATHSKDREFICADCNKHFGSRPAIKRHIKQCHRGTPIKKKRLSETNYCTKKLQKGSFTWYESGCHDYISHSSLVGCWPLRNSLRCQCWFLDWLHEFELERGMWDQGCSYGLRSEKVAP